MPLPVLVIAGPTASGKSRLAIDVAVALGGEVINADSMQVYRELRVLTARPSPADEARVPHRLFGVIPAAEVCSVGRWLSLAAAEMEKVRAAGRLPIVVGGSGLYLKGLVEGLAPIPDIPAAVRGRVRARYARIGEGAFRAALAELDPASAERIAAGDRQRLIRAFEVVEATGRPLSAWLAGGAQQPPVAARFRTLVLRPPRTNLHAAAAARFERMLAEGAIEEVRALLALNLDPELPAMKAVGVPELAACLGGEITLETATELAKRRTRHLAKRQLTWLRHQLSDLTLVSAQDSERFRADNFSIIRQFLLTDAAQGTK